MFGLKEKKTMKREGFTLIELLIVVAIIAILAAIAVPNFLEAQVRSKVSRCQADLRMLTTALEAYCVDNSVYPPMYSGATQMTRMERLVKLTTPIAYVTSIPLDIFDMALANVAVAQRVYPYWDPAYADGQKASATGMFQYLPDERMRKGRWAVMGAGPDQDYEAAIGLFGLATEGKLNYYDPTNGTVSNGDVVRFGP
jgi:type II secretion system protein G